MTKDQITKKIVDESKSLSIETLNEVLDFIEFKKHKTIKKELSNLNDASLSHLESEFINYKKRYPREQ